MKLDEKLNSERVQTLYVEQNAYINHKHNVNNVSKQSMTKVIFPEPYENANSHYQKNQFSSSPPPKPTNHPHPPQPNMPMFDIKSLLPMLMSGKLDMLKPFMSMFGGGNGGGSGMDFAKIFELLKPKAKPQKEEKKQEDVSSKFDDMIIIED